MLSPNYTNPTNGRRNTRLIIIAAFIFIVLIMSAVLIYKHNSSSNFPVADQGHSTTFQGMSAFIDNGLTTQQVNGLIKDFSRFLPKSNIVSIDTNSLYPGPHDPHSSDPSFSISFNVNIDSSAYKGVVRYSGLESVGLILS